MLPGAETSPYATSLPNPYASLPNAGYAAASAPATNPALAALSDEDLRLEVEGYILTHSLDDRVAESLRKIKSTEQRAVMSQQMDQKTRNPSATVWKRIRTAQEGSSRPANAPSMMVQHAAAAAVAALSDNLSGQKRGIGQV